MRFLHATLAACAFSLPTLNAISAISRQGRYLYDSNGSRFSIKGIAYQEASSSSVTNANGFIEPTNYVDPLADGSACQRDLPYLQQLGVNTIRVYSVNSAADHSTCMSLLSNAGIYVIVDLSLPVNGSIDRASPAWTTNLLELYTGTIDTFRQYDNVLAFNIGNEIVTAVAETVSAPFIKAATRDIKAYLASKGSSILTSYSSTDGDSGWRMGLADYLGCADESSSIDLYGVNVYRWCGASSIDSYSTLISDYQNFTLPAYFSEFGCITSPPRLWTEVSALYGSQMNGIFSGGVAFSYFPTTDGYGMITLSSDNSTVTTSDDFTRLQSQYSGVTFPTTPSKTDAGANQVMACPATSSAFLATTTLPGTPNSALCECVDKALSCVYTNEGSSNSPNIIGELLDYTCSAIGTLGGTCDAIGGNGATGVYGAYSQCDPATKLSVAFTEYYELSSQNTAACYFGNNATIVSTAPGSAASVSAAESACGTAAATAVSTPGSPASTAANGSSANGTSRSSSSSNASVSKFEVAGGWQLLLATTTFATAGLVAGLFTLA